MASLSTLSFGREIRFDGVDTSGRVEQFLCLRQRDDYLPRCRRVHAQALDRQSST